MADEREGRMPDLELTAMEAMAAALVGLDGRTRRRVLKWAEAKFVADAEAALSEEWRVAMQAQLDALRHRAEALGVPEASLVEAYAVLRKKRPGADGPDADEIAAVDSSLARGTADAH